MNTMTSVPPYDSVVDLFLALAEIDSPSLAEKELLDFVTTLLRNAGFLVRHDFYGNLVASDPSAFEEGSNPLVFTCHADMVSNGKPIDPKVVDGYVIATGGNCLGADNKASLACLLWVVLRSPGSPVELVISRNEENGFVGARSFDASLVRSRTGVNLDGTDASEIAVSSQYWYQISYSSTAAEDELEVLAQELGCHEDICGASVWRDSESSTPVVDVFTKSALSEPVIHQLAAIHCSGNYRLVLHSPGYSVPVEDGLVLALSDAVGGAGLKPRITHETVGTEGSVYNSKGIKMITSGVTISDYHTPQETVAVHALHEFVGVIDGFIHRYTRKDVTGRIDPLHSDLQ